MGHCQQQAYSRQQPPLAVIAEHTGQTKGRDQQQHQIMARTQGSQGPATRVFGRTFGHVDEKDHFPEFCFYSKYFNLPLQSCEHAGQKVAEHKKLGHVQPFSR